MNLSHILARGAKTGAMLSVFTSAAILALSKQETGSAWAAINCVAHIADGDDKQQPVNFDPHSSPIGLAINATAMGAWGVLYAGALEATGTKSSFGAACLAVASAYVIDYHIVPPRYTPGIEARLSRRGVFLSYCVLGMTLTLSPLWNRE